MIGIGGTYEAQDKTLHYTFAEQPRRLPLTSARADSIINSMKYVELTVHTTSEASELVADALWNYSEGGVAVSDAREVIALVRGETGVYWDYLDDDLQNLPADVLVKGFFPPEKAEEDIRAVREQLEEMRSRGGLNFGTLEMTQRIIDGDDWIDIWKKHFRPIHIGARVVIVPAWIGYTLEAGEVVVTLDSNMAFGTGEHETTSMCLEALQEVMKEGDVVIDVGCGSGILGIAAAKLGAKLCYLTDIDPVATASAEHNCALNGVFERCSVKRTDLIGDCEIVADIALANITADVLCRLAPTLPAHVKAGGTLILSGIIKEKLQGVVQAFAAEGFAHIKTVNKGEWYACAFTKNN